MNAFIYRHEQVVFVLSFLSVLAGGAILLWVIIRPNGGGAHRAPAHTLPARAWQPVPVEHVSASEQWSPRASLPAPLPLDPVEAEVVEYAREAHRQLDDTMERFLRELHRVGHLQQDTCEISASTLAAALARGER